MKYSNMSELKKNIVFKKHAVRTAANESIQSDQLYLHYAELMARSCGEPEEALEEEEENSDEEGDDDGELSFEEKETEKQHLLYCQERSVFIIDKGFNQSGHGVDERPPRLTKWLSKIIPHRFRVIKV